MNKSEWIGLFQKVITTIEKYFSFRFLWISRKTKAKLESASSFMLKYSKITVW